MSGIKGLIKVTVALILIGFFLIFLQNCRSGSQKNNGELPICNPKLKTRAPLSSPFEENKIQINFEALTGPEAFLSLIVNTSCILSLENPLYVLGQKVEIPEDLKEHPKAALFLTVPNPIDQEQLEKDMYQSDCLFGISNDEPAEEDSADQGGTEQDPVDQNQEEKDGLMLKATDDPKADEQAHLAFLNVASSFEVQNHITEEVIIAVLDTGINANHPDLKSRMWDRIIGEGHGADFTTPKNGRRRSPSDDHGQGTHIAGIIAAKRNNDYGGAGLLGGFVKLISVKVLGGRNSKSKGGKSGSVFNGINFAVNRKANVINLSLGDDRVNVLTMLGVQLATRAGVFISIAAGDEEKLISDRGLRFPASAGSTTGGVMTVASVDTYNGQLSRFSNRSADFVEIGAPGAERSYGSPRKYGILSTDINGGYSRRRGTAMAAAMVSAAAALLIGYFKSNDIPYSPAGIERTLATSGSRSVEDLKPHIRGGRVLDFGALTNGINQIAECE